MISTKLKKSIYLKNNLSLNEPIIFIDTEIIHTKYQNFLNQCPKNVSLVYPVKSFPMKEFFNKTANYLGGFEISNLNEFSLIENYINNKQTIFLSNFFQAKETLPNITADYIFDIGYLEQVPLAKDYNSLSLRVKPSSDIEQGEKSRFGLELKDIIEISQDPSITDRITTLHFHIGFEKTSLQDLKKTVQYLIDIKEAHLKSVKTINIGGGISTLSPNEILELLEYLEALPFHFYIEAGRYFSEDACFAVGKVLSVKKKNEKFEVLTNLSHECHLKWDRPLHFTVMSNNCDHQEYRLSDDVIFYGLTAYENDIVAAFKLQNSIMIKAGDTVIFDNLSGYAIAWNTSFNGLSPAKIFFI
ncbi:MAG: hypothetical protein COW01_14325 [Bdellovibrionales bacterium CG12_big_fil_rev_8_21_14_0_65_38_15]|nr:MAG: hypothetical protein COW79_17145 [Bdellovibrionales bacterium CG22_combo_CG10-13_8_21_14_all_38_13]PIQ53450.1 MAG: hypothetical protein COW01_14325 [Bdellovibrionales bacterium CG12_big_fil_rev_8_21_14_0_65_38_15]PIR30187.1 MAG: hypothetical protein COV38_05430 [Bdellovibrionales bacterium CG11_big_fil_rev_8_21_14_0_20_38_13]